MTAPYQTVGGWMIDGVPHVPVKRLAAEREACAKIADARRAWLLDHADTKTDDTEREAALGRSREAARIAEMIRNRSDAT